MKAVVQGKPSAFLLNTNLKALMCLREKR